MKYKDRLMGLAAGRMPVLPSGRMAPALEPRLQTARSNPTPRTG
jgi:hypothetical protein